MNMFNLNEDFYPTPEHLVVKMIKKVNWRNVKLMLEPSAGAGQLILHLKNNIKSYKCNELEIKAIEIENDFQAILRSKDIKVIDSDFLKYQGLDQFDLIMANFPFSEGHKHLLKAIDILFNGQIVCLINAETIRKPYTNDRKALVRKLKELNADIEYIQDGFIKADRKTDVEVAMIYIKIERTVENDLFANTTDTYSEYRPENIDFTTKDIAVNDNIESIVREYEFKSKLGLDTIINYYKNLKYIGKYMELITDSSMYRRASTFTNERENLTKSLKEETNQFVKNIRRDFWNKTLSLPEVQSRLTEKRKNEFLQSLKEHEEMEFTESNVRQFMLNLISNYDEILKDAIEEIFNLMTTQYSWDESIFQKNIRYYNGWKTNKSFKVNKKVILPYCKVSYRYDGWYIDYEKTVPKCNDIDKVMNYFDRTYKKDYIKITDTPYLTRFEDETIIRRDNLKEGMVRVFKDAYEQLESEYFKIRFYKKGSMHLAFKNEEILRAFNIEAGKRKGWLPNDYGTKKMSQLTYEEKDVVSSFEDDISNYDNLVDNKIELKAKLLLAA